MGGALAGWEIFRFINPLIPKLPFGNVSTAVTDMSALPEIAQTLRSFTTSTIPVVIRFCFVFVISRDGGTERRLLTAERYESMNFTEV